MNEIIRTIDRLSRLEPGEARVLSVYLSTDPSRGPGQNLRAHVRDVLHPLLEAHANGGTERDALEREIRAVGDIVEELTDRPRGLALFRSTPLELFETLPLAVAPQPGAKWARRAHLRPLLSLLDEHEPTLLLLLDKERARVFRCVLDTIEEVDSFEDEVPPKHSQGGESQKNFQRHHDEHVLQNVRRAVAMLERHAGGEGVRRIALGGPAEVLSHVRRHLPAHLTARLAGTVAVPVYATPPQVLEAAHGVEGDWEREEEMRLVSNLEELFGRGRAVFGAAAVVDATVQQQTRTLVFSEAADVPGALCDGCDLLLAEPVPDRCPACGTGVRRLDDLLDRLATRVLRMGGRIEEVRDQAAERLDAHGGVGAELRYSAQD